MNKLFVDRGGKIDEFFSDRDGIEHVRFPVKLSIKSENKLPLFYSDFILNMNKGEMFIKTDVPMPKDSFIVMHFYIPPEEKLLGEFKGKVIDVNLNNNNYTRGMFVKFIGSFEADMKIFVDYLEEKQHLVDIEV